MLDEPNFFWKNYRLGTELQISGTFIYNAIYALENMQTFYYVEECFEFLYNISIGIERLQKIAVILIEHDQSKSQEEFEKTLMTHNHIELLNRIKKNRKTNFIRQHNKFLTLIDDFYKSIRYERFNLSSVYQPSQDKERLIKFISKELNIEIKAELNDSTEITNQIRNFLEKLIKTLTCQLYEIIREESYRIGTFTYEISYNSKSFKIFIAKEFNFKKENLMQREVLLYLLKELPNNEFKHFIDRIEPLQFEQLYTNKYIESVFNIHKSRSVIDEMDYLYEEQKQNKERLEDVMVIGSNIDFDFCEEFDEESPLKE